MKELEMLYEGKAKKVFATENPDQVIVDYKDDATAFNGQKKGTILGKGVVNNKMTNFLFKKLEDKGIPTHLIEELDDRRTLVKKWKSFLWRLLSETRLPEALQSVWDCRKVWS